MKTEIKNGVTIIHTGDAGNGIKNKLGVYGITFYEKQKRYRSEITIKKKKMVIGFFDNKEMAIKARKVAEEKKKEGILIEWIAGKPHGNSANFETFWNEQFEKYNL